MESNTTLPFFDLIFGSGPVASLIMGILALMSFAVWGIIVIKYITLQKNLKANREFSAAFVRLEQFAELTTLLRIRRDSPLKQLTNEVLSEASKFSHYVSYDSIHHRSSLLEDSMQRSVEGIRLNEDNYLGFLGMSSNLSPFLGLFGTVWGIMSSFYQIGQHGSADLSVVAPGIAAALVTTAGGLIVAIPSSAAYNIFVSRNNRNEMYYYNFASRILSLFKRGDLLALEQKVDTSEVHH